MAEQGRKLSRTAEWAVPMSDMVSMPTLTVHSADPKTGDLAIRGTVTNRVEDGQGVHCAKPFFLGVYSQKEGPRSKSFSQFLAETLQEERR